MDKVKQAFRRFQYMAWATGVLLGFMTVVGLPFKYVFNGEATWYGIGWQIHGYLYMAYLLVVADLGIKARWGLGRLMLTALWGTIPFMSFVAERQLRREYA